MARELFLPEGTATDFATDGAVVLRGVLDARRTGPARTRASNTTWRI
jgi:hypothetical protein